MNIAKNEISSLKKYIKSIVISDSIILSVETVNDNYKNLTILQNLCLFIAKIQEKLALENIWMRGAISHQETHFDEDNNQVVGEAYINAYYYLNCNLLIANYREINGQLYSNYSLNP